MSLTIEVHPPTATITIDGTSRRPDKAGLIELPWTEAPHHDVVARMEGHQDFHRRVTRDEMAKSPFEIRLVPEIAPPPIVARPFRSTRDVLAAIGPDLGKTPRDSRQFQRYFSFTNLHNENASVTVDDLRAARAALAHVVKGLSRGPNLAVPKSIDPDETILKIDVRELTREKLWKDVLSEYPYGVKHDSDENAALRELAKAVYDRAGSEQPYIRADWFVWYMAPPPLRDDSLGPPERERAPEGGARGEAGEKPRGIPRAVQDLARRYAGSLGASEVAGELGIADAEALVTKIQNDPDLRGFGLKALGERGRITREKWQDVFELVITHLNLGVPFRAL